MTQMLSQLVDFLAAHQTLAILFAFLVAFGEALLIVGLFVPSTIVLVGLGILIGLGKMAFLPVFAATVAGAIAGDGLSFWIGVHWKEQIRSFWPFSRYGALMAKGEQFIARHGGKSIFIVRFIPGAKAVVPTIAGMMGMPATRFALANVGSAFVGAAVHLLPAIALGRGLQVATAVNPRVAILAGLGAAAAVLAWVLWPSDVVAGMLFGGAMVCGVALLMHARVVTLPRRLLAGLLTVTLLGVMPLHVWTGWSAATARYDATPPLITLAATDWRSSGWQKEPANRVLLDGEPGEPMLLQTFRPLADLVTALKAAEWNASQVTLAGEIQSAVVPSRQTLDLRAPWPMTHLGRSAMATLTKSGTADTRLVLRIWATQTVIRDGTSVSPLLLVSLTADRLDPLTFGYAQLEEAPLGTDRLATERTGLFAAIARIGGEASGIVELPLVAAP